MPGAHPRRRERLAPGHARGPDGRSVPHPDHPHVDDLDGAFLELVAVLGPMLLVEAPEQVRGLRRPDVAGRERDPELVALTDVAKVPGALEVDLRPVHPVVPELFGDSLLDGREVGVEAGEVEIAAHLELGLDRVVAKLGGEEADRGGDAGVWRDDDFRDPDPRRDLHGVKRPRGRRRRRGRSRVDRLPFAPCAS